VFEVGVRKKKLFSIFFQQQHHVALGHWSHFGCWCDLLAAVALDAILRTSKRHVEVLHALREREEEKEEKKGEKSNQQPQLKQR
jgi:hypothetical protein